MSTKATDSTPGMAAIRSTTSCCMRVTRSGSGASAAATVTCAIWICSGCVNPGSTWPSACSVRIISPDETSSTSAIATCPTTSARWRRCRCRLWLSDRPPLRSAVARLGRTYLITGIRPNAAPDTSDSASANSRTRPSIAISSSRGRWAGRSASRTSRPPCATARPAAPPSTPSDRLSTSSPRAMRLQPAPSAARTASSCWRPSTRTRRRFATFAHAIRSTTPRAPISSQRVEPRSPTTSCFRGTTCGWTCPRWNCSRV